MSKIKLAAQLYTVREYCKSEEDVLKTLKRIKEIGFDGVEVDGLYKVINVEKLASLLDKIGLEVSSTHSPFYRSVNDIDSMINEAKILGCDNVSVDCIPADFYRTCTEEDYYKYTEFVKPITEKLKQNKLKLAYKLQNQEFIRLKNTSIHGFDIIFENTDSETFYFVLDTYWLHMAGIYPADYVQKVSGRMDVCCFRDMIVSEGVEDFFTPFRFECEVGKGNFNFEPIIDKLKSTGVKWITVKQSYCARDPFDSLNISYRNIKDML